MNISITSLLSNETSDLKHLWYDWFCKENSLTRRGENLFKKLKQIAASNKFDNDKSYVFFRNNCPAYYPTYDDFRICDLETGEVIFTVIPKYTPTGKAALWGRENGFAEPIITGTWTDIKKWFLAD